MISIIIINITLAADATEMTAVAAAAARVIYYLIARAPGQLIIITIYVFDVSFVMRLNCTYGRAAVASVQGRARLTHIIYIYIL